MHLAVRFLTVLILVGGCTRVRPAAPPDAATSEPASSTQRLAPLVASDTTDASVATGPGDAADARYPILIGAGDIADCRHDAHERTAKLLDAAFADGREGLIFAAGDLAYDRGTTAEFESCYDKSWGRHKARTRPAVGNHEYMTRDASGYFGYWGEQAGDPEKGWYAYSLGGWRILVLNSNCDEVDCEAGSEQERWVREELKAHEGKCALAYWHHPRFSSGPHGNAPEMRALYKALDEGGVDLALTGHDHHYERFAPQDANGNARPDGIRQFIVGTGGRKPYRLRRAVRNSEVRESGTYGVLELTLKPSSYAWRFVPVEGGTFTDAGEADCH